MGKVINIAIFFALAINFPFSTFASQGETGYGLFDLKLKTSTMMSSTETMAILGQDSQEGVKVMAHLMKLRAVDDKSEVSTTHHIMAIFVDEFSGEPIAPETASVKVQNRAGTRCDEVSFSKKNGYFGADLALRDTGKYLFTINSVDKDGKKRKFSIEVFVRPFKK